jgi:hypothetical protein
MLDSDGYSDSWLQLGTAGREVIDRMTGCVRMKRSTVAHGRGLVIVDWNLVLNSVHMNHCNAVTVTGGYSKYEYSRYGSATRRVNYQLPAHGAGWILDPAHLL